MQQQQQSAPSRKRPAPGMSPLVQQPMTSQQPAFPNQQMSDTTDFSHLDFNGFTDQTYPNASLNDTNYSANLNNPASQLFGSNIAPAPSTDLIRRRHNQELAPQNGSQERWSGGYDNMPTQDDDDERDLEYRVQLAKKEAQGKRKQIPPFVQKLSSFLDNNHTELIRWSDDGRSFIVLDEDEFARTLIPELFKHNNYASFVRQLNMYGFHKTVNITDGSLRQSEKARKGVKPPSMYSHPYFRKNRPELLWLIQKPTGKSSAKRKREGTKEGYDSDEERQYSPAPEGKPHGELGPSGGQDVTSMPRGEFNAVRQEIKKLQQQQSLISRMIGQLKEQNDQFYRQATAFQALHDRHENSINAILTFLATFYNRSLEGHAGQNLVNMFSNPGNHNSQQQQGGVVEEYNDGSAETNNQIQRYNKRPQLLLTGPDASSPQFRQGSAVTEPNSARASASPSQGRLGQPKHSSSGSVTPFATTGARATPQSPVVKEDAPTPDLLNTVPESDEMLSLINNINATAGPSSASTPAYEYSDALNNLQKANGNASGPMSTQQANDMISLINQQTGNSALTRQSDNFSQEALQNNNANIEHLTHLANDNQSRLDDLHARLGPLSPTGSIPGLASGSLDGTGAPGQYDPNSFTADDLLSYSDYRDDPDMAFLTNDNGSNWTDYDYTTGAYGDSGTDMFGAGDASGAADSHLVPKSAAGGAGTIESISSESTSPVQVAEEGDGAEPGTPNKRQRRN